MHLSIQLSTQEKSVETNCLIDSRAAGTFIDKSFVRKHNLPTEALVQPVKVHNVDGTPNREGHITHRTWLDLNVHGHTRKTPFLITSLGQESMILGYTWLQHVNPDINWKKGTLKWKDTSHLIP